MSTPKTHMVPMHAPRWFLEKRMCCPKTKPGAESGKRDGERERERGRYRGISAMLFSRLGSQRNVTVGETDLFST